MLVVEVAADVGGGRARGRRLARGGGRAGVQVDGVVGFAAGHAQVEDFHDGVAGAAGDEAFAPEREERVDGGEVVDGVLVRGGAAGGGTHVVESGLGGRVSHCGCWVGGKHCVVRT